MSTFLFILVIILIIISLACFSESKIQRKGVRLVLSITLAIMIPFIMAGCMYSLAQAEVIEGTPLIILYFALPIVSFVTFQLLLYDIRLFGEEK